MSNIWQVSDCFARAAENPLSDGSRWTKVVGYNAMKLVVDNNQPFTNFVEPTVTSGANCFMVFSGVPSTTTDQKVCISAQALGSTGSMAALLRVNNNGLINLAFYALTIVPGTNATQSITRMSGGLLTTIGTFTATNAQFDMWTFEVVGSTLTVRQNGVLKKTVTDTTLTSGSAGFGCAATTLSDVQIYQFAAGFAYTAALPTLTQSTSDSLQTVQNPLNSSSWITVGGGLPGRDQLEVISHSPKNLCVTTISQQDDGQAINKAITWPNNCWMELTIENLSDLGAVWEYLRVDSTTDLTPAYAFSVVGALAGTGNKNFWILEAFPTATTNVNIIANLPMTITAGDIIKTACKGALWFLWQNTTLIAVIDTSNYGFTQWTGSGVGMQVDALTPSEPSDASVINFAGGSVT